MESNKSIADICEQFLTESSKLPLLKNLPKTYNDFHRVRVRQRKDTSVLATAFDDAFGNLQTNIHQRAIFAHGIAAFATEANCDTFFVLPINNYRFLYSPEVTNSSANYKLALDTLLEEFEQEHALTILTELLKFTYTSENLTHGIERGAEIIIYNIPFFFAIRCSAFDYDYNRALQFIHTY